MEPELRKRRILHLLENKGSVSIREIVRSCHISEITARRDLSDLEEKGFLVRTHGGAMKSDETNGLFDFRKKALLHQDEKIEICRKAAEYVKENDTIYLDCGTTVHYMSRFLRNFKNLRVITNSLPVVGELLPFHQITVYLIGGELDHSRNAFYGPMTENLLERYKADKAFIGAGGISLKHGLSSIDEKDASVTRKMAEAAQQVFLLCDSSKLEKDSYFTYSSLSLIDYLITGKNADPFLLKLYEENQINLITI